MGNLEDGGVGACEVSEWEGGFGPSHSSGTWLRPLWGGALRIEAAEKYGTSTIEPYSKRDDVMTGGQDVLRLRNGSGRAGRGRRDVTASPIAESRALE